MAKRPTMVDIGERAGVSQATVSLVLNGVADTRVAAATRERVLAAAEALGYRRGPRHTAAGTPLPVIGLLIDEVSTTPFASLFIEGAREQAAQQEVAIATFCTAGDSTLEASALDMLARNQALGILYTKLVTQKVTPPEKLAAMPTVLLNCYDEPARYTSVVPADRAGAAGATQVLIRAGHRRIAHLAGEDWIEAARDREQGYRQALTEAGLPVDTDLILRGGWTVHSGRDLTNRLLDLAEPPTAIFCFNDRMAIGAYDAIRDRGLSVPDYISVVGFDDEELVSYLQPPLTTMVLPHDEMARWAVGAILGGEVGAGQPARRVKLECELVDRQSIAAPRLAEAKRA